MPTYTVNLNGQALTKTDDTNVTLTLGGTPATALLKAVSLTLGWTGTLADSRIASASAWNAKESALTFSTGLTRTVNTITIDSTVVTLTGSQALSNKTGLISQWTNDAGYLTSVVGYVPTSRTITINGTALDLSANRSWTVGDALVANPLSQFAATTSAQLAGIISDETGSGALVFANTPTLVTPVIGAATGTSLSLTGGLTSGTSSSAAGTVVLKNATNSFTQTIRGTNPGASITYDLPTTAPTAGQVLSATAPSAGVSTLSWATAGSGITVGTTTITSGTNKRIPYNNSGVYGELANFTIGSVGTGILDIPTSLAIGGTEVFKTTTSGQDIAIGAGVVNIVTGQNVVIGYAAGGTLAGGAASNVFIGRASGYGVAGASYNVALGGSNGVSQTNANSSIAIGYNAVWTASRQAIIGAAHIDGYITDIYLNGVTHTTPYSVTLNACGGSGTNIAGASLTISGGRGTGTGVAGDLVFQTSVKGASGTTLQTLGDSYRIIGKYVDLTESSATAFATVTCPTSGSAIGGMVHYTIEANDGTDYQSLSGMFAYSIVNKAGTLTVAIGTDTQTNAVSSGTLTATATITATGTTASFKLNAVSSLTQTVLRCNSQVFKNFGTGVIASA